MIDRREAAEIRIFSCKAEEANQVPSVRATASKTRLVLHEIAFLGSETNTCSHHAAMHLLVGKRISIGQQKGTIRYRGPVPPASGEWLGIEWDDPARGKHDGTSADGTRYFNVRVPGSGSFIRPTASKLSSGCCFLSALRNKYSAPTDRSALTVQSVTPHQYSRKNIADIEIETPNLDRIALKTARLDRLREVGLSGWQHSSLPDMDAETSQDEQYNVATAFDEAQGSGPGSIRATCPNIRWLDLSRSLLPDWEEVSLIASELAQLKTLLLHFNRLQPPPKQIPTSWSERLGHVQDLRLDGTLIQWSEVLRLAPALRNLRSLHIGSNEITSLSKSSFRTEDRVEHQSGLNVFPCLTSLSLEGNAIESWSDLIYSLSPLASLETLNLDRNRISIIPAASSSMCKLAGLKQLYLRGNKVESWSSLENIAQWLGPGTSLEALHISTVPDDDNAQLSNTEDSQGELLSKYEYRDFRAIAIARLPMLRVLDKTEITLKERKDAELFVYTRFRGGDAYIIEGGIARQGSEEKVHLSEAEKFERFPRLLELAKLFDDEDPWPATDRDAEQRDKENNKKNTLRSKMLNVSVIASTASPESVVPHVTDKLAEKEDVQVLASTPLRLLKIKLANAVGVKVGQVDQVWALMKQALAPEPHGRDERSCDEGRERIVLELDDMSRSLDWYEVSSGDSLVLVTQA